MILSFHGILILALGGKVSLLGYLKIQFSFPAHRQHFTRIYLGPSLTSSVNLIQRVLKNPCKSSLGLKLNTHLNFQKLPGMVMSNLIYDHVSTIGLRALKF